MTAISIFSEKMVQLRSIGYAIIPEWVKDNFAAYLHINGFDSFKIIPMFNISNRVEEVKFIYQVIK